MAVDVERVDHAAVITLNDPGKRNALSPRLVIDFLNALDSDACHTARALVICAVGPAFCAGADITGLRQEGWLSDPGGATHPQRIFERLIGDTRPTIAAVEGLALGGGFELVLSCDLAVATGDSAFALPELNHGVMPNVAMALLPGLIGRRKALELIFTRRRIASREAQELGLINHVVPVGLTRAAATALAHDIVTNVPPAALANVKARLTTQDGIDWLAVQASLEGLDRQEWEEGLDAFLQKRKPNFDRFWNNGVKNESVR